MVNYFGRMQVQEGQPFMVEKVHQEIPYTFVDFLNLACGSMENFTITDALLLMVEKNMNLAIGKH